MTSSAKLAMPPATQSPVQLEADDLMRRANENYAQGTRYGRRSIKHFLRAGRDLEAAKAKVGHGNWGRYLKVQWDQSERWAQDLMKIWRAVVSGHISPKSAMTADLITDLLGQVKRLGGGEGPGQGTGSRKSNNPQPLRSTKQWYSRLSEDDRDRFLAWIYYDKFEAYGEQVDQEREAAEAAGDKSWQFPWDR
jgi:hypothetical protein